jgi:hypothetical protein
MSEEADRIVTALLLPEGQAPPTHLVARIGALLGVAPIRFADHELTIKDHHSAWGRIVVYTDDLLIIGTAEEGGGGSVAPTEDCATGKVRAIPRSTLQSIALEGSDVPWRGDTGWSLGAQAMLTYSSGTDLLLPVRATDGAVVSEFVALLPGLLADLARPS